MSNRNPQHVVLYHADCIDGFGAAWAAWRRLGAAAEYVAVTHGDAPPDVAGKRVTIVDFSYSRPVLLEMAAKAAALEVVDHHKTALENLAGLGFCTFDMAKSGAVLAWEHFNPGEPVPPLLKHVQDKDLWQWKLPGSAEITCALRAYPFEFSRWSMWVGDWPKWERALRAEGDAILRYQAEVVKGIVASAAEIVLAGHRVLCANTPILQSEVAGALAQGRPFGVTWYEAGGRRYYSLRSRDGGIDVADLARHFGGGGHAKAAGFSVDVADTVPAPAQGGPGS